MEPSFHPGGQTLRDFSHQGTDLSTFDKSTETGRERYAKAFDRLRMGHVGASTNIVQRALDRHLDAVVERTKRAAVPRQMPNMAGRAVKAEDYTPAIEAIYIRLFLAFAPQIIEQFSPKALKQNGDDAGPGNLTDQERARFTAEARTYVRNQAGTLIKAPLRNTKRMFVNATRSAVEMGLRRGWGTDRIAEQIREEATRPVSKVRARRIARTETIRASNVGSDRTARSLNLNLWKEWVAILDARTRATHVSADGQRVLLDNSFSVGGFRAPYPAAANLPPHESINCRCVVVYERARRDATQSSLLTSESIPEAHERHGPPACPHEREVRDRHRQGAEGADRRIAGNHSLRRRGRSRPASDPGCRCPYHR